MSEKSQAPNSEWTKLMIVFGALICGSAIIPFFMQEYFFAGMIFLLGIIFLGIDEDHFIDVKKGEVYKVVTFFSAKTKFKKRVAIKSDFSVVRIYQFSEKRTISSRIQTVSMNTMEYHISILNSDYGVTIFRSRSYEAMRAKAVEIMKAWNLKLDDKVREKMLRNLQEREARLNKRRR